MSKHQLHDQYESERLHHTPWVEKYRPKSLDDVAAQDHAIKVLKKSLESANLPHMLFYGPPGTGKTSTILALAKQLFGPRLYKTRVMELNASDERGIAIVRHKIKNFARLTISNPTEEDLKNYPCPPYKIIILDEADSMTNDAQSALRRTMENYSGVTRFCLICNYITRIIDPLVSRCSKFRFKSLGSESAIDRLQYIVQQEDVNIDEDALHELLQLSRGDLRKAITLLQSASKLNSSLQHQKSLNPDEMNTNENKRDSRLSKQVIQEIAGVVPEDSFMKIIHTVESKNVAEIYNRVHSFIQLGWSAQQVLDQMLDEYVLHESLSASQKNNIAKLLFETDRRLTTGTDEHIQLLNLCLQVCEVL